MAFFQLVILFFASLGHGMAQAEMISIPGSGPEPIRGNLSAGWRQMTPEELNFFEKSGKGLFPRQGQLMAGFRLDSGNALVQGPLMLAFEVRAEEPMEQEQIQKIYSWFEKQRELVAETFPNPINHMTIENIEYLPAKTTILFQSAINMEGDDFICLSSIIFVNDGFWMLIGLTRKNAELHREDISSFMRSVQVPESRLLKGQANRREGVLQWLSVNWDRALGFTLLLSVFAVVLRRNGRGKSI